MPLDPSDIGPVATLLARSDALADALAGLHARVQKAASATCSVLLEIDPETGRLHPTSGRGLDHLAAEPWCTDEVSRTFAREVLDTGRPRQIAPVAEACPTLARRLKAPAAYLAPVRFAGRPLGLLVLGLREVTPPLSWSGAVLECAAGFAVALTHARLRHDLALQAEVASLMALLGQDSVSSLPGERLQTFCLSLARVFGAERVELWRHDRDVYRLTLACAAPPVPRGTSPSISADDAEAPVAAALRRTAPVLAVRRSPGPYDMQHHTALLPLRGRRRALGVLVLDHLRLGPGDGARLLPHFEHLASRFAALLESTDLIDQIIRARRDLENTFDSMSDPLVVCGPDGRIARSNEAFARFVGSPRAAVKGQRLPGLLSSPLAQWFDAAMRAVPEPGAPARTAEMMDDRTGAVLHVNVAPLAERPDLTEGFVISLRDVTDERRLESERAALRERLAQSETLGHLVAGIAHEINNPLQAVTGHVELVRRTGRLPPAADAQLALVHREADRAARIVRNLLLLAGSGRIVSRPISVNAAVRRALANRRAAWRTAGIQVDLRLDPGLPKIHGDALLLQQAVLNVLLNAEQALGDGGRIGIRTGLEEKTGRVEVHVTDSGPGIPAAALPRIFDPFFTTKEAGRGLGLSLVLRIVHEHLGDLEARNRPEGGAEFLLHFPVPMVLK